MTNKFVPSSNAVELNTRCKTSFDATSELLEMMISELPPEKQQALQNLLSCGGRIGLETTFDRSGGLAICLIAKELEGQYLKLATISTVGPHAPRG